MKQIPILGVGTQSRSSNVNALSLINMFSEQSDDKGSVVLYGTPGLELWVNFGDTPIRGWYSFDDATIYVVHKNKFYSVNAAGIKTELGTLTSSTGRVDMTHNPTQLLIVDGSTTGYVYTFGGAFAAIADVDFPGADTCAFNNGRAIVNKPNTGQYWLSNSYDFTNWVATNFATAESSPDNLIRVMVDHGELILFGDKTTEFAVDTGGLDFPYTRVSGATAEWGLAARWSVAKFDNSLIWLAKNRMGEVQVTRLQGYQLVRVSTFDLETLINDYTTVSDATGLSYIYQGHLFYQLNFPTANKSWLYDGSSDKWSEVRYGLNNRHLANMSLCLTSQVRVAHYSYGHIYNINSNLNTDNGTPIISEFTGKHVSNGLERLSINNLQVDCETGIGSVADPQIMLQISKDNGHTWLERWADLGAVGNYQTRAIFRRLGMSRDWVFRFRFSENIKRVVTGVWIS